MSEVLSPDAKRLHPASALFFFSGMLQKTLVPLFGLLVLGNMKDRWALIALLVFLPIGLWAILRACLYRYQIGQDELIIRNGVIDRTLRHIPFSRIQSVNQKRKLLHRLLGVTELQLESSSGKKPEAVMKVLSMAAAAELEALLHGKQRLNPASSNSDPTPSAPAEGVRLLHHLPTAEIIRLGLISNKGMMLALFVWGAIMQKDALRKYFFQFTQGLRQQIQQQVAAQITHHSAGVVLLEMMLLVLLVFAVLRLFSVLLAFIRYRGFTLELEGEKLMAQHGMGTHVRTSARLPRLQRWELAQSWLHRRFGRCRLAVTVVGNNHHDDHNKISANSNFTELAPIATPEQAQALLRLCLPRLNWEQLQWQSLPHAAKRRLLGQARWVLPAMALLVWTDYNHHWQWPWPLLVLALGLTVVALIAHALAWQRFAAFAESDEVLVFRSGVFQQRWVIISTPRLQALRLSSSPLDRRLGMCTLQADTQGGSRRRRALQIPCLSLAQGQGLRERIWQRLQSA